MNIGTTCSFTGHRPTKLPWQYDESDSRCMEFKEKLEAVIGAVYESGITHFISGMALGCDIYCAEAVLALKREHPEITLEAAVPFRGQADKWNRQQRARYESILNACDTVTVLQEEYSPHCMMRRNRYLVDNASVLIACYDGQEGGTWNTVRYAMSKDREIIQLPIE